ncbi:hypothetical protein F5884DRAFT_12885 [Xylogone sp. PMI_703]|nr:hypothetical protein F5884DRAFT_12885 [Xylogone sp. PMI_703]
MAGHYHPSAAERAAISAEFEDLLRKAIADPQQITDEEKRRILGEPSAEVEAANIAEVTGGTMTREDLLRIAREDTSQLTLEQAKLIGDNFCKPHQIPYHKGFRRGLGLIQSSQERVDLTIKAEAALRTEEEYDAFTKAERYVSEKASADSRWFFQERQNQLKFVPEWTTRILNRKTGYGYVYYRATLDAEGITPKKWSCYVANIYGQGRSGFKGLENARNAIDDMKTKWIEHEYSTAQMTEIREHFCKFRESPEFGSGLMKHTFVLATPESYRSDNADAHLPISKVKQWIWVCDPDWKPQVPGAKSDDDGYDGRLKIYTNTLYTGFYVSRSEEEDNIDLKDLWRQAQSMPEGIWTRNISDISRYQPKLY